MQKFRAVKTDFKYMKKKRLLANLIQLDYPHFIASIKEFEWCIIPIDVVSGLVNLLKR